VGIAAWDLSRDAAILAEICRRQPDRHVASEIVPGHPLPRYSAAAQENALDSLRAVANF